MHTVVETPTYLKAAESLFSADEQSRLIMTIAADPESGDVMPGTGGYRKLRFGRAGVGKRGGARVIYLYGGPEYPVFLITAYAKNQLSAPTKEQQNKMAKAAKSVFESYGRRA